MRPIRLNTSEPLTQEAFVQAISDIVDVARKKWGRAEAKYVAVGDCLYIFPTYNETGSEIYHKNGLEEIREVLNVDNAAPRAAGIITLKEEGVYINSSASSIVDDPVFKLTKEESDAYLDGPVTKALPGVFIIVK